MNYEEICNKRRLTALREASLRAADLSGASLRGADLYATDLREASLRGADLRGASLRTANLYATDLRGASLRGADLTGASLRGADLHRTDLRGADLRGADLRGADLRLADLNRTRISYCIGNNNEILTVQTGSFIVVYVPKQRRLAVGCIEKTVGEWLNMTRPDLDKLDRFDSEAYVFYSDWKRILESIVNLKEKNNEK